YRENTKKSHQKIVDYNINDCNLVYEILEKTNIIDLAINRSKLTGQPLEKITGSIASFDSLYLRECHKKNLASPTNEYKKKETKIKGGYVSSLNPGIYKNVLVLDFKSLYPSIIRTFNIDPASYIIKQEKDSIKSPNGALFKNQEGILPIIIERLHQEREKAKKEKNELASYAIKTIMNSFFGVLASPNCRYFDMKMANAITNFGQFIIKLTAKEIEKKGLSTIYSDTDSVFIETKTTKEKAHELGIEIQNFINNFYQDYIKKNYKRKSFLELEFDKHYLSLMIPQTRNKEETAAKKRYAGLIYDKGKEELDIVGLEAIRGDWTEAAQDFQREILMKTFHDEPIEKFIKEYVKKIRAGKLDQKLVYKKSIRKNLEEYTKMTPPHVKAARLLDKLESNVISYYITINGPEPIQKLKHSLDYDHYIEKQIKPIANQILTLLNKKFEDLSQDSKQSTLF
ncbi:MAG: DNA polymerase domain-containing protein, partial [Nanoarchaeota archaeon]